MKIRLLTILFILGVTAAKAQVTSWSTLLPKILGYDNAENDPNLTPNDYFKSKLAGWSFFSGGDHVSANQNQAATVKRLASGVEGAPPPRKGTYSYRTKVVRRYDYNFDLSYTRSEFFWGHDGGEYTGATWFSFSMYIPTDYCDDGTPVGIGFDSKFADAQGPASFYLKIQDAEYQATRLYPQGQGGIEYRDKIGPLVKGAWVDWALNRNFKDDATGFMKLYKNKVLVWSWYGPNYNMIDGIYTEGYMLPFGIYKWPWSKAGGTGDGNPTCTAPIVFYYDEIKIGYPTSDLDQMSPGGSTSNLPPTASAGSDKFITQPATTSSLAGQGSDPDGTISYQWSQVGSSPAAATIVSSTSATTSITGLTAAGVYTFVLTVTDNLGATAVDNVTITVNQAVPNAPPTAYAGNNITQTLPLDSLVMPLGGGYGAAATDPEGGILTYAWTLLHGTATLSNTTFLNVKIRAMVADYYTLQLVVTDDKGLTATDTVNVTVYPLPSGSAPPVAVVSQLNITITIPVDSVLLDGTDSYVIGDSITTFAWTRLSGPNTPTYSYASRPATMARGLIEGTYVFRLIITAVNTLKDTADVTVIVLPAPLSNDPPVIEPMDTITLNLSNITAEVIAYLVAVATDPDGTITSYQWLQVSGPSTALLSAPDSTVTGVTDIVFGTYVFQIRVGDNDGLFSTANIVVQAVQPLRRGFFNLQFKGNKRN